MKTVANFSVDIWCSVVRSRERHDCLDVAISCGDGDNLIAISGTFRPEDDRDEAQRSFGEMVEDVVVIRLRDAVRAMFPDEIAQIGGLAASRDPSDEDAK